MNEKTDSDENKENQEELSKITKLNSSRSLGGKSSCKSNEGKGKKNLYNSQTEKELKRNFYWW